jgi:DNA-directed RNA polymerase subunit RPC12/RpoP
MKAVPEYKCKRCGKVFDGRPENNPRIDLDNLNQWLNNG